MLKLIKYLKPFVISIIIIIGLLFTQAMCDLSLPEYMSNIVNTGIQQNGVENAVPEVIRKGEFDKAMLFVSASDKSKITSYYDVLDKNKLSDKDYQNYVKDYPVLKNEVLYKLNTNDSFM
jgi:ATP-binding cassette subfamily B protein